MLIRDSGVAQLFAENAQEAYDLMLVAPRVAEHPDVLLPVLVCLDGFTITHAAEPVELVADADVGRLVGPYSLSHPVLDTRDPGTPGPFAMPAPSFEPRRQQAAALEAAQIALGAAADALAQIAGRRVGAVDPYRVDGADRVVVALGSTAGTIKDTVD